MVDVLYVPGAARSAHGRGAERRRGASSLLQSVINALSVASGPASVRERFERELRSMVRARAVAVCEGSPAPHIGRQRHGLRYSVRRSWRSARGSRSCSIQAVRSMDGRASCSKRRRMSRRWCWRSSGHWDARRSSRASGATARRRSSGRAGPSGRCASASSGSPRRISRSSSRARVGHRQGARRAADSRPEPAAQGPVRRGELRGDRRDAARGGAVRHRGPDGDRRPRPAREVRARARRDAVPRRSVRPLAGGAGQAAARDPGSLGRAGRRMRHRARSTLGSSSRRTGRCPRSSSSGSSGSTCTTG